MFSLLASINILSGSLGMCLNIPPVWRMFVVLWWSRGQEAEETDHLFRTCTCAVEFILDYCFVAYV